MKKFVLPTIFLFLLLVNSATGNPNPALSPLARVSVLTASPGPALYSAFGHNALRVVDPILGIDEVYNYGTFDFDTPNFYLRFLKGQLNYKLSVSSIGQFVFEYQSEGRQVIEQVLNLNPAEVQQIYNFLQVNRLPENAYYLYDFFFDNCATRIRDLVDLKLLPVWPEDPHPGPERSFRNMLNHYIVGTPWARIGIHLVLGMPSDRVATPWEYMFLPDDMKIAFDLATLPDGRPLVLHTSELIPLEFLPPSPGWFSPTLILWLLVALGVALQWRKPLGRIFDKVFFSVLGIAGFVIFFLWFVSDHTSTDLNLNLLWVLPTHLYFIFKSNPDQPKGISKYYFSIAFFFSVALLLGWPFLPQEFHPAFLPLLLYIAFRCFVFGFGSEAGFSLLQKLTGKQRAGKPSAG